MEDFLREKTRLQRVTVETGNPWPTAETSRHHEVGTTVPVDVANRRASATTEVGIVDAEEVSQLASRLAIEHAHARATTFVRGDHHIVAAVTIDIASRDENAAQEARLEGIDAPELLAALPVDHTHQRGNSGSGSENEVLRPVTVPVADRSHANFDVGREAAGKPAELLAVRAVDHDFTADTNGGILRDCRRLDDRRHETVEGHSEVELDGSTRLEVIRKDANDFRLPRSRGRDDFDAEIGIDAGHRDSGSVGHDGLDVNLPVVVSGLEANNAIHVEANDIGQERTARGLDQQLLSQDRRRIHRRRRSGNGRDAQRELNANPGVGVGDANDHILDSGTVRTHDQGITRVERIDLDVGAVASDNGDVTVDTAPGVEVDDVDDRHRVSQRTVKRNAQHWVDADRVDQRNGSWVFPTFHLSNAERSATDSRRRLLAKRL